MLETVCVCARVCLMTTLLSVVKSSIRLLWLFIHRLRSGPVLKEWILAPSPATLPPALRTPPCVDLLHLSLPPLPSSPPLCFFFLQCGTPLPSPLSSSPSLLAFESPLCSSSLDSALSLSPSCAPFFYSSFHHPPTPTSPPSSTPPHPAPPHPSLSPSLHFASAFKKKKKLKNKQTNVGKKKRRAFIDGSTSTLPQTRSKL